MRGALLVWALVLVLPAVARADITVGDVTVTEGNGPVSATFTLTRTAALLAPERTVTFATSNGSAVAPFDYVSRNGSATFSGALLGGTQTRQVTVTVVGDELDEPDETFRLLVVGQEVVDGEGVARIVDDDPEPAVRVGDAAAASEGDSPRVSLFGVTLSRPSDRAVAVSYATFDGSATAPADYTATSGRLAFAPGATRLSVVVPIEDDTADEPSETLGLRLSAPEFASLSASSATATGIILDDDDPPAPPRPSSPELGTTGVGTPETAGSGTLPGLPGNAPRVGMTAPRLRRPATVLMKLTCPVKAGRCRGRVTLFNRPNRRSKIRALRRERNLGRRTFSINGGRSKTLRFTLSGTDRRLVARARRVRVRAYAVLEDAMGRTGVRSVNGTLVGRKSSPARRR